MCLAYSLAAVPVTLYDVKDIAGEIKICAHLTGCITLII